jgi:uncharacterized repeat protein (TIGR03803 family)
MLIKTNNISTWFWTITSTLARACAALVFAVGLGSAHADVETVRHSFSEADGVLPEGIVIKTLDGSAYGVTEAGGAQGYGTVYKITPSGTISVLHSFDGERPNATLMQASDGALYGTLYNGGANGVGAVYRLTTSGDYTTLASFPGAPGGSGPLAGLIQASDGNFYGTTRQGGAYNLGTVFRMTPSGALTSMYDFTGGADGLEPEVSLLQASDGALYGSTPTSSATTGMMGTIYRITLDGVFTLLHSFNYGGDGSNPSRLIQASDGYLYGTTQHAGPYSGGVGTVFRMTLDGSLTTIHAFQGIDGDTPWGGVFQGKDGALYGSTVYGGINSNGTLYRVTPDGIFTDLYLFTGGVDGSNPYGFSQAADGTLLGTTANGGTQHCSCGTLFVFGAPLPSWISLPPLDVTVTIGFPVGLALQANDSDQSVSVHIGGNAVPIGASFASADGNSAQASVQWIPVGGQAGDYTISFTADANSTDWLVAPQQSSVVHVVKRNTQITAEPSLASLGTSSQIKEKLSATLVDTSASPHAPISGVTVQFTQPARSGGKVICTARTGGNGVASCSGLFSVAESALGYVATFAGDNVYLGSTAQGTLATVSGTAVP